jgi:spore coat protein A
MKKTQFIILPITFCLVLLSSSLPLGFSQTTQLLDSSAIPKFVNQLDHPPPVFVPTNVTDSSGNLIRQEYTVKASEFNQQMLPTVDSNGNPTGFGQTTVLVYEGKAMNAITGENLGDVASTPGCTFEAIQGIPVQVKWVNNLVDNTGKPLSYRLPVDPTLHWANPKNMPMDISAMEVPTFPPGYPEAQTLIPIVTHLHGGETPSASDGNPDAWWTADGKHGPAYNTAEPTDANAAVYVYPNEQPPTALWYHDHALGLTRLNVLSGLAGFYLIRNSSDPVEGLLPKGEFEMPLCIQDRSFLTDGSLFYPTVGSNSEVHPYWRDSFLGNTVVVNGKVWPNMNVKRGQYRLRLLDGSNSRFYQISFSNGMPFTLIGTDGGYTKSPVELTSVLIAPAQRIDILVDFSNIPAGEKIVMENFGGTGDATGQIIQFTVADETGFTAKALPSNLNPTLAGNFPTLPAPLKQRILTLVDVPGQNGSEALLLDGQKWAAPVSETPTLGSTEDWILVNPTMEAHPIHVHLVQFQLVQRQTFDVVAYSAEWSRLNGDPPFTHSTINVVSLDAYLTGEPSGPSPSEQAWVDTIIVYSGEAVKIRMRWTQQNGSPFMFDATAGPGYVWHCHLLEHEDNEMMRPYIVVSAGTNFPVELIVLVVVVAAVVVLLGLLAWRLRRRTKSRDK